MMVDMTGWELVEERQNDIVHVRVYERDVIDMPMTDGHGNKGIVPIPVRKEE